jgi:hypothetical protein
MFDIYGVSSRGLGDIKNGNFGIEIKSVQNT